jgi:serine/threonine-protein kinase
VQSDRPATGHARTGVVAPSCDPLTGRLLDGRYRIAGRIARGGMASVYEATDLRLDRTVAIKVMHAGLGDDDEFAARFVREARSAARLSHPNVVSVYDQGNDDGVVFLAMELVEGHTLRDVIRSESPMSPARALALLEPVVSALAAAHRAGLIHRDVKPENVLIAEDGRIKVADFGLARAVSADTQHTATGGVLIGTVSYLAPELVVNGRADARADVYAVGVLLYELLTGSKPHEAESPIQVAYKHVHEDVPPPSRLVPGIPAYVDALVARATARDRGQRPADAAVLLHQLHRVAHALAEGVRDDPDLTADLTPILLPPDAATSPATARPGDTAADPWDADEMAALLGPGPVADGRTTALPTYEPPPVPHRERPTQPPPAPPRPVEHAPRRPRRRRPGPVSPPRPRSETPRDRPRAGPASAA